MLPFDTQPESKPRREREIIQQTCINLPLCCVKCLYLCRLYWNTIHIAVLVGLQNCYVICCLEIRIAWIMRCHLILILTSTQPEPRGEAALGVCRKTTCYVRCSQDAQRNKGILWEPSVRGARQTCPFFSNPKVGIILYCYGMLPNICQSLTSILPLFTQVKCKLFMWHNVLLGDRAGASFRCLYTLF